jgi:AraC family L-rhamnose operon regulatory protein RhaS
MIRQMPVKPLHFPELFEEYGSGSIARLPLHRNGGVEIHYLAKGHLHWEIEGRAFLVPPHSVFFTFPWEEHGSCLDFEPGHFFHFLVFRVKNPLAREAARLRLADDFALPEPQQAEVFKCLAAARERCLAATPAFAWLIAQLSQELAAPGLLARTKVVALSQAILCELVRCVNLASTRDPARSERERIVQTFLERLRSDCAECWTLDEMATACRLKRTQFETLIKEATGDTPFLLLNRFRVRRAQLALIHEEKTITEIAYDCGFGSSQYFARVFQKLVGTTPSEYRRQRGDFADYDRRFHEALARLRS